jgi:hypothetical protein
MKVKRGAKAAEAAQEYSPGRKPGVRGKKETKP